MLAASTDASNASSLPLQWLANHSNAQSLAAVATLGAVLSMPSMLGAVYVGCACAALWGWTVGRPLGGSRGAWLLQTYSGAVLASFWLTYVWCLFQGELLWTSTIHTTVDQKKHK